MLLIQASETSGKAKASCYNISLTPCGGEVQPQAGVKFNPRGEVQPQAGVKFVPQGKS
jgi:hypothetical protein